MAQLRPLLEPLSKLDLITTERFCHAIATYWLTYRGHLAMLDPLDMLRLVNVATTR